MLHKYPDIVYDPVYNAALRNFNVDLGAVARERERYHNTFLQQNIGSIGGSSGNARRGSSSSKANGDVGKSSSQGPSKRRQSSQSGSSQKKKRVKKSLSKSNDTDGSSTLPIAGLNGHGKTTTTTTTAATTGFKMPNSIQQTQNSPKNAKFVTLPQTKTATTTKDLKVISVTTARVSSNTEKITTQNATLKVKAPPISNVISTAKAGNSSIAKAEVSSVAGIGMEKNVSLKIDNVKNPIQKGLQLVNQATDDKSNVAAISKQDNR